MVKVGDRLMLTPRIDTLAGAPVESKGPQPCVVVYVHLAGRFYVAEFTSKVTGARFRETFFMQRCERDLSKKQRRQLL